MVRIAGFHPADPGSSPGVGIFLLLYHNDLYHIHRRPPTAPPILRPDAALEPCVVGGDVFISLTFRYLI